MKLKIRRFIALYIDFIITFILAFAIWEVITFGQINQSSPIFLQIIKGVCVMITWPLFLSRKDLAFKNASIGKKIMKIEILNEDGSIPTKEIIVKRITSGDLLFSFEVVNILFENKTNSDKRLKTKVVYSEKKKGKNQVN